MAYGNQSKRNDVFEVLNRTPNMFNLLSQAEDAIYRFETDFMLDDETRSIIEKINKHLGRLDSHLNSIQNKALEDYKKLTV